MGSLSSIEVARSARSVQPAQSTKSLQKFISLFQVDLFQYQSSNEFQKDGMGRLLPKRSRSSLPESRVPLSETTLKSSQILRQGWLKHQEVILGKKGSRSQWNSRWAILSDSTMFLCMQPSTSTAAEVIFASVFLVTAPICSDTAAGCTCLSTRRRLLRR